MKGNLKENHLKVFYVFTGDSELQLQIAVNVSVASFTSTKNETQQLMKMRGYVTKVVTTLKRPFLGSSTLAALLCLLTLLFVLQRHDGCSQSQLAYVIEESPRVSLRSVFRADDHEIKTGSSFNFPVMQHIASVPLYIHRAFLDLRFAQPVIRVFALEHKDSSAHEFRCIFKLADESSASGLKTYNLEAKR